MRKSVIFFLLFLLAVSYFLYNNKTTPTGNIIADNSTIPQQTKFDNCMINGMLPDRNCTPGAIFLNATKEEICTPGYSSKVRDVSEKEKNQVYEEYGIASHTTGQYEVDHLISLELGGSNDISNLWPEAALPTPGFHEKDKVENQLHDDVCSGKRTLDEAQRIISTDWTCVMNKTC